MRSWLVVLQLVGLGVLLGRFAFRRWRDPRNRARRVLKGVRDRRIRDLAIESVRPIPIRDLAMEGVRDTLIRELADGVRACVTGTVKPLQALQPSPVDQRSCIGFRSVIERAIRGDPSNGFRHVLTRESCDPFSISDESGTAIVQGPFIIDLEVDDSAWTDLPPALFRLLEDAGVPSDTTDLRFSEAFLLPGDKVTIVGTVSVDIHPAGEPTGFREPPVMRRIIGTDRTPVMLRDAVEEPVEGL